MSTLVSQSPLSSSPAFSKKSGADAGSGLAKHTHTILPPIHTPPPGHPSSTTPNRHVTTLGGHDQGDAHPNPFVMPPPSEVFTLRERERQKLKEERARDRKLRVHEKTTYSSRLNTNTAALRKHVLTPESSVSGGMDKDASIHEDTQFVLSTTKDRHLEKEDLTSYVARKREMFLVQYALGVKRDEIKKLEEIAKGEEKKLEAAEKYLEQSATMFDEFLKENDKNAVEAIKMAEAATKAKLEKVAEIKRLNTLLVAAKNDISRNHDLLTELRTYKAFLDSLAPQEWREQIQQKEAEKIAQMKKRKETNLSQPQEIEVMQEGVAGTSTEVGGASLPSSTDIDQLSLNDGGEEDEGVEEDVELFFTDPNQLLNIFTELEEQNLSLIQNSQETEVTLEEMKQNRTLAEKKMSRETESLKRQIDLLKSGIAREEEKADELEIKSRMYSYGEYKAEDQELMLGQLHKKVTEVYTKSIGPNEANIPTLQMLAAIESRLEDLFDTIEGLPTDKIEAAEKAKEKERRLRLREEKLEEQRLAQEERLRRALERAQADPKKRMGRKLVYRSEPPILKRKQKGRDERKEKEEEEMQYFFS